VDVVPSIRRKLGEDVVLLNVASGAKKPTETGWQKFTVEKMRDATYLDTLNHGGNIGVLLGKNSGGLHTIDIDLDAVWDAWLVWRRALVAPAVAAVIAAPGSRAQVKPEALWEHDQAQGLSFADFMAASRVRGELLHFPPGQPFSMYSLAALLPLLPAKQRPTHPNDWMSTDAEVACPDPHCPTRFRITRVTKEF
jgi:uncharacterized repeat protein (TIGR04076 family)